MNKMGHQWLNLVATRGNHYSVDVVMTSQHLLAGCELVDPESWLRLAITMLAVLYATLANGVIDEEHEVIADDHYEAENLTTSQFGDALVNPKMGIVDRYCKVTRMVRIASAFDLVPLIACRCRTFS